MWCRPLYGLHPTTPDPNVDLLPSFRQCLNETGYVEGDKMTLHYL